MKPKKPHNPGFTLVELMMVIAVTVIVLTIAVPSFQTLIKKNKVAVAVNELVSTLNLARSEAIKRGDRVTVCKSADGAACAGSGGWDQGWIVFVDSDSDAVVDAGEEVLSVNGALDPPLTMIGNGNVANYVSFVHDGTTQTTSGALQMGTVTLCGSGVENEDREIVINNVGRTNLRKKTCS